MPAFQNQCMPSIPRSSCSRGTPSTQNSISPAPFTLIMLGSLFRLRTIKHRTGACPRTDWDDITMKTWPRCPPPLLELAHMPQRLHAALLRVPDAYVTLLRVPSTSDRLRQSRRAACRDQRHGLPGEHREDGGRSLLQDRTGLEEAGCQRYGFHQSHHIRRVMRSPRSLIRCFRRASMGAASRTVVTSPTGPAFFDVVGPKTDFLVPATMSLASGPVVAMMPRDWPVRNRHAPLEHQARLVEVAATTVLKPSG